MKTKSFLFMFAVALVVSRARAVTNPVVNATVTTVYANVTDPIKLAFAPDGTLFVGRDNSGSGGNPGDAVKIHRIAPGGSPVTEYGAAAIPDPDAVAYDALGVVSGTPGAVLVGGSAVGNGAVISKINTNGAVTQLFGGVQTNMNNPGELLFDASGRLYISDSTSNRVFATSSSAAPTNLLSISPAGAYELALDVSNRLAVASFTGIFLSYFTTNGAAAGSGPNLKPGSPVIAGPGDDFWGRELYAVNSSDQLIRIDSFGNTVVVGTNFDGVISMAFGPDHALYVSYRDYDVILRIAPQLSLTPNHWWPAEGNASNAVNTAHGTLIGGVTYQPGKYGQAFNFDGISGEIQFATNAGNFGTGDFTVMYWVKTTNINPIAMYLMSKWTSCGSPNFWSVFMGSGGTGLETASNDTGTTYRNVSNTNNSADNVWHHIAWVRRGGEFRSYRDGVLGRISSTNFVSIIQNNAQFRVGASPCVGSLNRTRYIGMFDDIKLFNSALTPAQIAAAAGLSGCAEVSSGAVAWWKAEGDAQDSSGANHGSLSGATFAPGQVGQAFSFDGANDGVSVPDAVALRPVTNLTIEGWIKTPGISEASQAGFIVARSGNAFTGYEFLIGTPSQAGRLRFTINGGSGGADLFSTNSVTDNFFHHVAATYDGTVIRLYRDGLLDGQKAFAQPITYQVGDPLWIGRREFASIPGHFAGLVDELTIYNRTLSASEIAAIHAAGLSGKCPSRPTLNIAALPGAVRLTWPTNATGYLLETNGSLALPANWGVLTSNYSVIETNYAVTNTIGGAAKFYRLGKP